MLFQINFSFMLIALMLFGNTPFEASIKMVREESLDVCC